MRSKSLPLIASAAALLLAGAAAAQTAADSHQAGSQQAASSKPRSNKPDASKADTNKAPWDVTSDHLNGNDSECIAIWTGNAEALQVDRRLKADVLTAHFDNKNGPPPASGKGQPKSGACGDLIRLEATGHVYYVTPQQKVHGDYGVYEAADDTVTVTGNGDVVAVQGQNVLRGDRMVFNNRTGEGHMEGGAKGANKSDRPRGIFYPKQSGAPAAGTASSGAKAGAKGGKPGAKAPAKPASGANAAANSAAASTAPASR